MGTPCTYNVATLDAGQSFRAVVFRLFRSSAATEQVRSMPCGASAAGRTLARPRSGV
ncbi:hypothetical protein [Mycobacterium sp. HNNTM2301]|uniref:hypothetical protein n=1 Tax=Mycobacterium hainanense TaxID=3289775 RepID=UPI0035A5D8BC